MDRYGERKIDPRETAQKLAEISPLSEKQAVSYVYFNIIADPNKRAENIFHIAKHELEKERHEAKRIIEATKIAKKLDVDKACFREKSATLVKSGLITDRQSKAYRDYLNVGEAKASEMLGRPTEEIHQDVKTVETILDQLRETYRWIVTDMGVEVY